MAVKMSQTHLLKMCLVLTFTILVDARRYGSPSRTLHFPKEENEDDMFVFNANFDRKHNMVRRDVSNESSSTTKNQQVPEKQLNKNIVSMFELEDEHNQLIVHWAGQGSDVVVCLARDFKVSSNSSSSVYFSYDYGKTYIEKQNHMKIPLPDNTLQHAIINKFHNSRANNRQYVFTDVIHKYVFTTRDYGVTFLANSVPCKPEIVLLHPSNPEVILIMEKHDAEKVLYVSEDFGETWREMQRHVKSFFWGSSKLDSVNTLYVERQEPRKKSIVLKSDDLFKSQSYHEIFIADVEDFELRGEYMFATKRQKLLGSKNSNETFLQLWVSHKRQPFHMAIFPNSLPHRDYYVADASEGQVFLCVNHHDLYTNLYLSDVTGREFTLSLEKILYFNPHATFSSYKNTWLSIVTNESFADFYRVDGVRGIYIATQIKQNGGSTVNGFSHIISLITFDKGATWQPLSPPKYDSDGRPLNCNLTKGCSLHVTQKFSQLYPEVISLPILTRKSAPGLIVATGVAGKSLKGHPEIYVSNDAGLTWRQVLKENYFYVIGDHGGIIVATKFALQAGQTDEIVYSIDEGETWQTLKFTNERIRVYGLMVEPGEKTTIFTLFGSRENIHEWLLFKIDLKDYLGRKCQARDYKTWSPHRSSKTCLLGKKETFNRRSPRARCYNGMDYDRPITSENCPCRREDFRCDIGYKLESGSEKCVHDENSDIDSYAVPENCSPGKLYNRSRGYMKIPGDTCEKGPDYLYNYELIACPIKEEGDFILFSQRDKVNVIRLSSSKPVPVSLPLPDLKNVIAIEYDYHNNCVIWGDIDSDKISRLCMNGQSEVEVLVENNLESIEGLAFDWISKNLYFTDGGDNPRIEMIRVDINYYGRMRRTVFNSTFIDNPRGIAVDPVQGFLFWTDWSSVRPSISRSFLDGTNLTRLVTSSDIFWPNGLTVDRRESRVYWVDAKLNYVAYINYKGGDIKYVIKDYFIAHPFAIGIFKEWIYWDDWKVRGIMMANKHDGSGRGKFISDLSGLMDLKVFTHSSQQGTNACGSKSVACTHLCVGLPNNTYSCLCPDGMNITRSSDGNEKCLCPEGQAPSSNGTCSPISSTCSSGQYHCNNNLCIPSIWVCDGDNDCGDFSDESTCATTTCSSHQFTCNNTNCIPKRWRCDFDNDCGDNSDELNCEYPECEDKQFKCNNGRCIQKDWICDMDDDCRDGSDELNCTQTLPACGSNKFKCLSGKQCLPTFWRCDGAKDCLDGSDEIDCSNHTCDESFEFQCNDNKCIFKIWRCDGENDCLDKSDEVGCNATSVRTTTTTTTTVVPPGKCHNLMLQCNSGACIPIWWKCDFSNDCGDNSDEEDCDYTVPSTTTNPPSTIISPQSTVCTVNHFQCQDGSCIWDSWVCDGDPDCSGKEDEHNCEGQTCPKTSFKCLESSGCFDIKLVCDGNKDCSDGSDELNCDMSTNSPGTYLNETCQPNQFKCKYFGCIMASQRCDGHNDCFDNSDEENCKNISRVFQVTGLVSSVDHATATSIEADWTCDASISGLKYLPSISEASSGIWNNKTWTETWYYTFKNLKPSTLYNITVYVMKIPENITFVPSMHITARTKKPDPLPPTDVIGKQVGNVKVMVSWHPPSSIPGKLDNYIVTIKTKDTIVFSIHPNQSPVIFNLQEFNPEDTFIVSVETVLKDGRRSTEALATLTYNPSVIIDQISGLKATSIFNSSVVLEWNPLKNVDEYRIDYSANNEFTKNSEIITTNSQVNVSKLSPRTKYTFKVSGLMKKFKNYGSPVDISVTTLGDGIKKPENFKVVLMEGTTVSLKWTAPKDVRNIAWQYAVYYGLSYSKMLEGPKMKTFQTHAVLKKLGACEEYLICVQIVGPIGVGNLSTVQMVNTEYNHLAPPKNVKVSKADSFNSKDELNLTWSSSCENIDSAIGYIIQITEKTTNQVSVINRLKTASTHLNQTLKIHFGGKYAVVIRTSEKGSRFSESYDFAAPVIDQPFGLKSFTDINDSLIVMWEKPISLSNLDSHKYKYMIWMSEEDVQFKHARKIIVEKSPAIINNLEGGKKYYIAVSLVDEHGYQSIRSSVISTKIPLSANNPSSGKIVVSKTNLITIVVPIAVVVLALSVALLVFFVRHRRLQRSFLSFANSHYNTRSGATTFSSGGEELVGEEDSPMIQGFSDDEPLVIA